MNVKDMSRMLIEMMQQDQNVGEMEPFYNWEGQYIKVTRASIEVEGVRDNKKALVLCADDYFAAEE